MPAVPLMTGVANSVVEPLAGAVDGDDRGDLVDGAGRALARRALLDAEVVEQDRGVDDLVAVVEDREDDEVRRRARPASPR